MRVQEQTQIVVQREWNGWRTAMVRMTDLEHIHWFQPAGAPRPLIHAYVSRDKLLARGVAYDDSETADRSVLVCVLKCHTSVHAFEELSRRASAGSARPGDDDTRHPATRPRAAAATS